MKRSEINKAIRDMEQMLGEYKFSLPEFCGFAPEKWKSLGHEYDEVRDNALGWDITTSARTGSQSWVFRS